MKIVTIIGRQAKKTGELLQQDLATMRVLIAG